MAEEKVKSVFELVDEGTAALGKISKSYGDVQTQAAKAQIAADSFSKKMKATPTGFAAAKAAWGAPTSALPAAAIARAPEKVRRAHEEEGAPVALPAGAPARAPAKVDEFAAIREESRARRLRTRGLKLEEQRGDILENAMSSMSSALGGGGMLGKVVSLTNVAEQAGFQMSAFGGKMGGIGSKLVGVAGTLGLVGAGASIVAAGLTALDDSVDGAITDFLSGSETKREREQRNQKYVKSLGYADTATYQAATEISNRAQKEIALGRRAEEAAQKLGAMPTDKLSTAMSNWESGLAASVRQNAHSAEEAQKLDAMMREAASRTSATWREGADRQAELTAHVERASKSALALALPMNATEKETKNFNNNIKTLADIAVGNGLALAQVPTFIDMLTSKISEVGSVGNVFAQFEKTENENAQVAAAFRKLKLPAIRASDSLELLHMSALQLIKQTGIAEGFSPEMTKSLAEKAFSKIDMAKSKMTADFRNSRFDIKQHFAEGFDPDRIAVAFTQDIVGLGEMRLQSGLAPIYSGR